MKKKLRQIIESNVIKFPTPKGMAVPDNKAKERYKPGYDPDKDPKRTGPYFTTIYINQPGKNAGSEKDFETFMKNTHGVEEMGAGYGPEGRDIDYGYHKNQLTPKELDHIKQSARKHFQTALVDVEHKRSFT